MTDEFTEPAPEQFAATQAGRMTEIQLQRCVVAAAHRNGWLVYHTRDSRGSQPGYPDLHLVHQERQLSLFRELKTETGRMRPDQLKWLTALIEAGIDASIWRPIDWFNGSIEHLLNPDLA